MHRHARGTARVAAHFPGCGCGPDDIYPARREEPARTHLRKLSNSLPRKSCWSSERTKPSVRRGSLRSWGQRSRQPLRANERCLLHPTPTYQAYGTTIALTEADIAKLPEANRRRVLTFRRIAEIAERA